MGFREKLLYGKHLCILTQREEMEEKERDTSLTPQEGEREKRRGMSG